MRRAILLASFVGAMILSGAALDNPSGSYQQTCRSIKMRGDTLSAKCKNASGHWVKTSLGNAARCTGDITNINGQLTCGGYGHPERDIERGLPTGSYTQTCNGVHVDGNSLRARCQTSDGQWVDTSLDDFRRCTGDITNIQGQLTCGGYGHPERDIERGAPAGSYTQTCNGVRVDGNSLRARCQTSDGRWLDTTLDDYNGCVGEIVNDEGRLECTRGNGRTIPQGTYAQTCRQIHLSGNSLRAQCETRDGRWVSTQLDDLDSCRSGIVNLDGQLHCDR
ncbi:MAG TPA: CVNH domain-containing protein [Candidatus Angelobacter sp.]